MNIHQHLAIRALHNMQHETRAEILALERAEIAHKQPVDDVRLHNLRQSDMEISSAISWLKKLPASIAMLLCLCLLPLMGAEDALPEDAQELMADYQEELDEAKAEYDEAVADATESVLKKLRRELKQQTRRGELAAATAIQAKIQDLSETLMLGKDADPEYPEKIIIDAQTGIVSAQGGSVYSNRGYQLVNLPDQFQSWKVVQQVGGAPTQQRLRASGPMTFYLVSMDPDLSASLMQKTDMTCNYTDPHRSQGFIYAVQYRGGDFLTPSTSAFSGVMIMVPHAEKR